jgi:hypothetical protein
MDRAPRKPPKNDSRLIAMAVRLVGSPEIVRNVLQTSEADFRAYRAGEKNLRSYEFDRLVALIIAEQRKIVRANRAILDEINRTQRSGTPSVAPPENQTAPETTMADDLKNSGSPDRDRINVNEK